MERQRAFTLAIQRQAALPWHAHQKFQEKQREVDEDILYVGMLRRLISTTTVLQHYVEEKAVLKSFLLAHLCSGMGKRFPCTVQNLYDMIVERRFHGVDLHTFTDLPVGTICTTPRCVCRALCAAPPRSEQKKDKKNVWRITVRRKGEPQHFKNVRFQFSYHMFSFSFSFFLDFPCFLHVVCVPCCCLHFLRFAFLLSFSFSSLFFVFLVSLSSFSSFFSLFSWFS